MPDETANLSRYARVPFDVQVQIDRIRMRIADLLNLKAGAVVALRKPAGDSFDVLVGGARIGSGEAVVVNDTVGVRLTLEEN